MTKADYATQRLDPRWQRKRLEVLERDDFKCLSCGSAENTLHVDHAYYVKGRKPWEYPMFSLSTLCADCHHDRHHPRALDPDEHHEPLSEWEIEIGSVFGGDPEMAGCFWYAAGEIQQLADAGVHRTEIYSRVEKFLAEWRRTVEGD